MKRVLLCLVIAVCLILGASAQAQDNAEQPVEKPGANQNGHEYEQEYGPGSGWVCPWCGRGQSPKQAPGYRGQSRPMPPACPQMYAGRGQMYHGQSMMAPQGCPWAGCYSQKTGGTPHHRYMAPASSDQGMMYHHGWARGWQGPQSSQPPTPLDQDEAAFLARNFIAGNPNLKVGEITETEHMYEASIVTKDDSLVERLLINKQNGWVKAAY